MLTKVETARGGAVPVVAGDAVPLVAGPAAAPLALYLVDLAEVEGGWRLAGPRLHWHSRGWRLAHSLLYRARLSIVQLGSHNKPESFLHFRAQHWLK